LNYSCDWLLARLSGEVFDGSFVGIFLTTFVECETTSAQIELVTVFLLQVNNVLLRLLCKPGEPLASENVDEFQS